jgi:hypothetical protein
MHWIAQDPKDDARGLFVALLRAQLENASLPSRRGSCVNDPAACNAGGVLYLGVEARFDYLFRLLETEDIVAKVNAAMRKIEKHNEQLIALLPCLCSGQLDMEYANGWL